ncbi:hypothetical protein [Flavobacterium sp. JP2137]|uniref:hypothetical protein n=1 Tax=Flavobacterium sp. JP2137 TaxID=3414510 RepID=UPI003D2FE92F
MAKEVFTEKQQFRQGWLIGILIAPAVFLGWVTVAQIFFKEGIGQEPVSEVALLLFDLAYGAFLVFFFKIKLITRMDTRGIEVVFWPFVSSRQIRWEEVATVDVVVYAPLSAYGGWGVRMGRDGQAYTVSGNKGLKIAFKNRENLLIGTQKSEELLAVLNAMNKTSS